MKIHKTRDRFLSMLNHQGLSHEEEADPVDLMTKDDNFDSEVILNDMGKTGW